MKEIIFSRKELYDLVWSTPISKLAIKYNVYDAALRKACNATAVPLPLAGHWARINVGKEVVPKPLPDNYRGDNTVSLPLRTDGQNGGDVELSPLQILQQKIENDPLLDLVVKERLVDPDPLVLAAQKPLSMKSKYYRDAALYVSGAGTLDIRASSENVSRALCIMDTFIKVMRKRGHDFKIKNSESYLLIAMEEMKMTLREAVTKVVDKEDRWAIAKYVPNGILILKFDRFSNSVSCKDGKVLIEGQLSKVIAKLELLGEDFKVKRAENEKLHKEYQEKKQIEEDFANRKRMELSSFKQILEDSRRWKEAILLRDYIVHMEEEAKRNGRLTDDVAEWLEWARKKADWFDPLLDVEDEWLNGLDPNGFLAHHPEQSNSTSYGSSNSGFGQSKSYWPGMPWYLKK